MSALGAREKREKPESETMVENRRMKEKKAKDQGQIKDKQQKKGEKQATALPKAPEFPAGIKWTKQRKRVYEILRDAIEPLSAAQIYARMEGWEQEQYAISTIYRILAAFEENKLVDKTNWMGEGTGVYELKRPGHVHYAVCLDCHRRIPLEQCPLHMALPAGHTTGEGVHTFAATDDFTVVSHKIELYGYCKDCRLKHE